MRRFLYFYLMQGSVEAIRTTVPSHVSYWKGRSLPNYLGGPFADRTGGLITFSAEDLASAEGTVQQDPFVQNGLIERKWVKEWLIE